jgi:hypothetical protein
MAPSAVETTTQETKVIEPVVKQQKNVPAIDRGYGRLFARNFDRETEEGRNGRHPGAKVSGFICVK